RNRRKRGGGDERDAGLIAKSREVIHAGQTHHLPPRVRVMPALFFVRAFDLFDLSFEEPLFERAEWFFIYNCSCFRHRLLVLPCGRLFSPPRRMLIKLRHLREKVIPALQASILTLTKQRLKTHGESGFWRYEKFWLNNFLNLTRTSSILPSHFRLEKF